MSERYGLSNKNTIMMINMLLKNQKYIDFTGRRKQKEIKESIETVKEFRKKLKKYEICIEDDDNG